MMGPPETWPRGARTSILYVMRQFSPNGFIIVAAIVSALVLAFVRPSPDGILSLSFGEREVRAAPGQVSDKRAKHDLTALDVFNVTLVRIRDAYVDPGRIDPRKMLYEALDSVQFDIPEVLVEPYPERDEVTVVVNDKKQTFTTREVDSPWRLSAKLKKIFRFIEAHMNPGADLAEVEYAAVNGMLNTLDPHSVLMDPENAREMDVSTSGKFGGLGIVIRMYKRKLTIIRPMKGTPAEAAGLQRGDHIVKINEELTEHLTLQEAVERMRGKPNTPITVHIRRKGVQGDMRVDLNRAVIRVQSVEYRMLDENIGYIQLKQFSGRSEIEVKEAMEDLRKQGAEGWVLDMRANPGGLLEQAIKISDLFVPSGTIVTTVGGREREPRRAGRKNTDKLPMAVLVNGNSASASEIVAGALKNLDRAVIIGATTFGKGSVQVLYDNKDGSKLKLTIAQYLTPGDRSIQSLGIVPDIELHRMFVPKKNDSHTDYVRLLPPSRSYKEKDLEAHLTSRYANQTEKPAHRLSYVYESPKNEDPLEHEDGKKSAPHDDFNDLDIESVDDYEIKLARDLVARSTKGKRQSMIETAQSLVERRQAEEHAKLSAAIGKLRVDWSESASVTGHLASALEVSISTDKQVYNAGDIVKITGTVTNRGSAPAYQVHGRIQAENQVFNDTEMLFGRVGPNETRTWMTRVKVPSDSRDRVDRLSFSFTDSRGAKPRTTPITLRIVAAERPVFAYSHQLFDDGNGDGLVQRGERHRLFVTIKNTGKGIAKDTTALLRNASGDGVILGRARFELGSLKPGDSKTAEFAFDITSDLSSDEAVVEMTVYDNELHQSVGEKLRYRVAAPSAGPAAASGYVRVTRNGAAIHEGALMTSGVIANASRGSGFAITGRQGAWYRIDLGDGRPGFINANSARATSNKPKSSALTPRWQVTPPTIALSIPSYTTTSSSYDLSGRVTDDTHVEDVYIFVTNTADKVENKKVFYKSNRAGTKEDALDFSAQIPLWPGINRVTVVARENDAVKTRHTMYLLRKSDQTAFTRP